MAAEASTEVEAPAAPDETALETDETDRDPDETAAEALLATLAPEPEGDWVGATLDDPAADELESESELEVDAAGACAWELA